MNAPTPTSEPPSLDIAGERPVRIQRSRAKGWRMPPNTVYVGRPTRWGNPFSRAWLESHGQHGCPLCQVVNYELTLDEDDKALIRRELAGKSLACWCPLDRMCHADILLAIANGHEPHLPSELTPHSNRRAGGG